MSDIKDYLYDLEIGDVTLRYSEEMSMRSYEESIGIELFDSDETPDEVFEPEYLGDR